MVNRHDANIQGKVFQHVLGIWQILSETIQITAYSFTIAHLSVILTSGQKIKIAESQFSSTRLWWISSYVENKEMIHWFGHWALDYLFIPKTNALHEHIFGLWESWS